MVQKIPNDWLFLTIKNFPRICPKTIRCRNQKPMVNMLAIAFAQKLINICLGYFIVRGIAFRLNSPNLFVFVPKNKIDAFVPTPLLRVVVP
jgi:hypothetical protein